MLIWIIHRVTLDSNFNLCQPFIEKSALILRLSLRVLILHWSWGQGNLWTEHIPVLSHAFYMTYPRALALSENLWSSRTTKDWNDFTTFEFHFNRFENDDLPICKALYDPFLEVKRVGKTIFSLPPRVT